MKRSTCATFSGTIKGLKRRLSRQLAPNLGTILAVALMLLAYHFLTTPESTLLAGPAAPQAILGSIDYQGFLTDDNGRPLNGDTNITLRLYDTPTGGVALWTEAHTGSNAVPVDDGLFNVHLGSLTPIPADVWNHSTLYLGVQVGTDAEMTPRQPVGAVPVSMGVADNAITTDDIQDGAVTQEKLKNNLCCGHTNTEGTGWVDYGAGVYIDIDTSVCNFPEVPMYFTSLAGRTSHWNAIGASSIYSPESNSFRVYVWSHSEAIDPTKTDSYDWYIQWCGIRATQ